LELILTQLSGQKYDSADNMSGVFNSFSKVKEDRTKTI
jgi:hypothetical protein